MCGRLGEEAITKSLIDLQMFKIKNKCQIEILNSHFAKPVLVAGLLSWSELKNIWVISSNISEQVKHLKKVTILGLYLFQSFLAVCTLLMVVGLFGRLQKVG